MKNLLLIILLGVFSPSFSQTGFSVPTKNAVWYYINYDGSPGLPSWGSSHKSTKDSVFKGVSYHTLDYYHLFRQDSNKVYMVDRDSQEVLLYDFGLEVGDIFKWRNQNGIVSNISTINIDGHNAKVFQFSNVLNTAWIEGIGNIHGDFFMPLYSMVDGGAQLCRFILNGKQVYIQTGVCWPLGLEDNNSNNNLNLVVSPNPSNGDVNISFTPQSKSFELIDIYGRVVKTYTVSSVEMKMDWQWLASGMYMIKDNYQNTTRFIKED